MANFVEAAKVDEIKPGHGKQVEVNGKPIALFNVDGKFFAIANTCPHQGGPLGEGQLADKVVTCPWHGWKFNVETGVSAVVASVKVPKYEVKVEDGKVMVAVD